MRRLFFFVLLFLALCACEKAIGQEVLSNEQIEQVDQICSGSVPMLVIETENHTPVLEKGDYLNATYYLKTFGWCGYKDISSPEKMDSCYIRCRGNWSFWGYDKKSYKLKLSKKEGLLGMSKNKHYVLLALANGLPRYMDTPVGYEVSRMLNLKWTPEERPVEVVVNGEYMGLYCLTEHVRVGKERVDIDEQKDNETDIDKIENGGWLVELDFYEDTPQIRIDVTDTDIMDSSGKQKFWLTVHSPEELSNVQYDYFAGQFQHIKDAVFIDDKTSTEWEELIDMEELVKYAMQAQITTRMEAFLGSTFIYKKNGNSKWCFGPVWDLESTIRFCKEDIFTWDEKNYSGVSILHEIAKYPRFQEELRESWMGIRDKRDHLHFFIDSICNNLREAVKYDAERWPKYGNPNIDECGEMAKELIDHRWAWLDEQLYKSPTTSIEECKGEKTQVELYDLRGLKIKSLSKFYNIKYKNKGLYLIKTGNGTKKIVLN